MPQNIHPDQGMSQHHQQLQQQQQQQQGQAPLDMNNEATVQQILAERNSLRSQNDQLWKIIEKQRVIIQNLQKDVSKVTAERDSLRQSASAVLNNNNHSNNTSPPSSSSDHTHEPNGYLPPNGQPHQHQHQHHHNQQQQQQQQHYPSNSKRSMERKAHDNDTNGNTERELELASGFNGDTSFSSTNSSHEQRHHYQNQNQQQQQHQQQQHQYQQQHQQLQHRHPQHDQQSPRQHGHSHKPHSHNNNINNGLPLTPSSTYESDFEGAKTELDQDESPVQSNGYDQSNNHPYDNTRTPPEEDRSQDSYDPEVQIVSTATRMQYHQPASQQTLAPSSHHERDPRSLPNRSEPTNPLDGTTQAHCPFHSIYSFMDSSDTSYHR